MSNKKEPDILCENHPFLLRLLLQSGIKYKNVEELFWRE
jgi:hypothetical protein